MVRAATPHPAASPSSPATAGTPAGSRTLRIASVQEAAVGFVAVNLFFESFQLITMVFSTTLIGIGIDYSYHYFFAEKIDKTFIKN